MAAYIILINFTEKGAQSANNIQARLKEFESSFEAAGGRKIGFWFTLGNYDMVAVMEAPDDETAARQVMWIAQQGIARTTTLRAFSEEEMGRLAAGMQQKSTAS